MPTTLTEVTSYDAAVIVPANGDGGGATSVVGPFQSVTNRTAYLKRALETPVASLSALASLAAPSNGAVRFVTGFGFYTYVASDASPSSLPLLVAGVSGAWYSSLSAIRIPAASVKNGLIDINRGIASGSFNASFQTSSSAALIDATGVTCTVPSCLVGDEIDISSFVTFAGTGGNVDFQIVVVDGGTPVAKAESHARVIAPSGVQTTSSPSALHVIATAGDATVKLQFNPNGTSVSLYTPTTITARRIRP